MEHGFYFSTIYGMSSFPIDELHHFSRWAHCTSNQLFTLLSIIQWANHHAINVNPLFLWLKHGYCTTNQLYIPTCSYFMGWTDGHPNNIPPVPRPPVPSPTPGRARRFCRRLKFFMGKVESQGKQQALASGEFTNL